MKNRANVNNAPCRAISQKFAILPASSKILTSFFERFSKRKKKVAFHNEDQGYLGVHLGVFGNGGIYTPISQPSRRP